MRNYTVWKISCALTHFKRNLKEEGKFQAIKNPIKKTMRNSMQFQVLYFSFVLLSWKLVLWSKIFSFNMHFSVDTSLAVFTNLACNTFIIIQIKFILVSIMIASRTHKLFRWVLKGEVLLAFHCCFLNISSFSEKTPSHPLLPGSIWFCTGKDCTFWMRRQDAIDQNSFGVLQAVVLPHLRFAILIVLFQLLSVST